MCSEYGHADDFRLFTAIEDAIIEEPPAIAAATGHFFDTRRRFRLNIGRMLFLLRPILRWHKRRRRRRRHLLTAMPLPRGDSQTHSRRHRQALSAIIADAPPPHA